MRAGYVSVKVVDGEGRKLDSETVLAYYHVTGSPLYNVVGALVRVSNVGDLFTVFWRENFKVSFVKEECVWRAEHYSYPVKAVLYPEGDGFLLEVVVPAIEISAERALLAAWRALRALKEVSEELSKLKERIGQLEYELKEQGEGLRALREELKSLSSKLPQEVGGGEVEEEEQEQE